METKIIDVEDLITQTKELYDLAVTQNALRGANNKPDQRLHVIIRAFRNIVASPLFSSSQTGNKRRLGEVVNVNEINTVHSIPDTNNKKNDATPIITNQKDGTFIEMLNTQTLEQLYSTKYSKDAQLVIIKRLNEFGAGIEVIEDDTKKILAEKIFNYLHSNEQNSGIEELQNK